MQDIEQEFRSLGIDKDYSGMDFSDLSFDPSGWGQSHAIFEIVMRDVRPKLVIEVGTWKGASLLRMFEAARSLGIDTKFICIDTWLGSHVDLWRNADYRNDLMLRQGYPTMFRQFIFNMIAAEAIDYVYPLPMTSTAAAATIASMNLKADIIYIDAAHDEEDVAIDIKRFYPLLQPGGLIFGDDYSVNWPGVVKAVNRFASENGLLLRTDQEKWWIHKPIGSSSSKLESL
jgi:cephalosporin hydroxylase